MRTNIDINKTLVRKAKKLTRLKTKRQIVDKALELLVGEPKRHFAILRQWNLARRRQGYAEKSRLILVDTSVWIDFLSSSPSPAGAELRRMVADAEPFALTGIVVTEILQGLRREGRGRDDYRCPDRGDRL